MPEKIKSHPYEVFFDYFLPGAGILAACVLIVVSFVQQPQGQSVAVTSTSTATSSDDVPNLVVFNNLNLSAKAAIVVDEKTGTILFSKNASAQLPLASLTKIMTTLVASRMLSASSTVAINPADLSEIQDAGDEGFLPNEEWSFASLARFTLVASSNQGADAIAGAAGALLTPEATDSDDADVDSFVTAMNDEARSLGLSQTYFINPSGLDLSVSESGGYGSASDMATLFAAAISQAPSVFAATTMPEITVQSLDGHVLTAENTDDSLSEIPGLFASKTGYTDLAGGNLAVAFDAGPDRPIIAVVLGSTETSRFTDAIALASSTLAAFSHMGQAITAP